MPAGEPPDLSRVPGVLRIHHVGILVRDAERAAETFRIGLGLEVLAVEERGGSARIALLSAGETALHLIQPLTDDSPWAAALRDHGEGAHHFALEVVDLMAAIAFLAASGVGVLDPHPRREAGDVLSVSLDPGATGGALIELVQQIRA